MEQPAVRILNANRIMAISTVRPDGWPQTTIVGYANRGFELMFMIFRSGQKFANIEKDDRISIAVCPEPTSIHELQAVYAAAHASQITDAAEREAAWRLLMERHSNLSGFKVPDQSEAVFMKAKCLYVSVLDFSQGVGHREKLVIDEDGIAREAEAATDEWADHAAPAN
jgi:nitroimidazol reductase NimA-like FMN-containing flavoprotein (pyridoxamine 5'-phosphate oxidase superfamily)